MMKHIIEKMSILAMDGGLWGDFTTIFLGITIFVMWNTCLEQKQCKIMVKVGYEFEVNQLNIFSRNNHFEPTKLFYQIHNDHELNINNENKIIGSSKEFFLNNI